MKKTIQCFLHYRTASWCPGYEVWSNEMTTSKELIFISSLDVEFEIPDDFDPRPAQIKALQEKQREAAAAFHAMNNDLMRQINELQALEMA